MLFEVRSLFEILVFETIEWTNYCSKDNSCSINIFCFCVYVLCFRCRERENDWEAGGFRSMVLGGDTNFGGQSAGEMEGICLALTSNVWKVGGCFSGHWDFLLGL